jgi:hypothetical protein
MGALFSSPSLPKEYVVSALHVQKVMETVGTNQLNNVAKQLYDGFKNCQVYANYCSMAISLSQHNKKYNHYIFTRGKKSYTSYSLKNQIDCQDFSFDEKIYFTPEQYAVYRKICGFINEGELYKEICEGTMQQIEPIKEEIDPPKYNPN